MDDQQAALLGLGRQHPGARCLAARHFLAMQLVGFGVGHDASASLVLLRFGRHKPRSIASAKR